MWIIEAGAGRGAGGGAAAAEEGVEPAGDIAAGLAAKGFLSPSGRPYGAQSVKLMIAKGK